MELLNNFLRFFLPFFILVLTGAIYTYSEETAREKDRLMASLQDRVIIGTAALNRSLGDAALDLHVLTEMAELTKVFNHSEQDRLQELERVLLIFSRNKGIYDQIRWIDEAGQERVRVNRNEGGSYLVATQQLQNKQGRYYFENTLQLEKNHFFISPLDLNVERGKVEWPLTPVIRIGTPVFDIQGNRRGVLLLNYSGQDLLDRFTADQPQGPGNIELLNQDGFWLHSDTPNRAWGFMLNRDETYSDLYPFSWASINNANKGSIINDEGGFVFRTVEPLKQISGRWAARSLSEQSPLNDQSYRWKVVASVSPQQLLAIEQEAFARITTITTFLLVMVALGSLLYARTQQSSNRMLANTLRLTERENLLTRLGEGVFGLDRHGNCTFINPKACELLGYDRTELLDQPILHNLNPRLTIQGLLSEDDNSADKTTLTIETTLFRKDSHCFDAYLTISRIFNPDGEITGAVIAFQDISDRKRSELELQETMIALDNEHQFMKTLIGTLPDMVWMKDTQGRYLTCNPEFQKFIGASEYSIIGKTDYDLVDSELADYFRDTDKKSISDGRSIVNQEWVNYACDGRRILRQTTKTPMRDNRGEIIGVLGIGHDITELKATEQRLMLQALVLDQIQDLVTVTDLEGHIIYINAAQAEELGYDKERILGHKISVLGQAPHANTSQQEIILHTQNQGEWQGEIVHMSRTGEQKYMDLRTTLVLDEEHKPVAMVGVSTDITERKTYQRQLERIAHFDPLTDLPNRVLLVDRLHQAMAHAIRHNTLVSIVYIDLDGFKQVNDTYGHAQGDHLLKQISTRMKNALREGDTLARIGGDEFVAALPDLPDREAAISVLQRILAEAASPVTSGHQQLNVSASIGVTFFPQAEENDIERLITQADHAMYTAKQKGKNQFHIFTPLETEDHSNTMTQAPV